MIISHEHKFIFLKTKKTAGTSIEIALSGLCGPDDILSPLTETDETLRAGVRGAQNWRRHSWWGSPQPLWKRRWRKFSPKDYGFYNHMPAAEVMALLNDDAVWRSYFKFAFDRNPWDRQVSYYHHRYRGVGNPEPFEHFVRKGRKARLDNYDIYSLEGDVAVDFVGRYETLTEDLTKALGQVGLTLESELPRAKGEFRKEKRPYREYYSDNTKRIVEDWYSREIKLLDYEF